MASKRMFSEKIVESDAFIDIPLTSQALYFHLSMQADDDGFICGVNKIIRMIGASKKDFEILVEKRFILKFESGVCVIKHWRINNYVPKDRYSPTVYVEEFKKLTIKDNNSYTDMYTEPNTECIQCVQDVYNSYTQSRLDKSRLDKSSVVESKKESSSGHFVPPSAKIVFEYCKERGNNVDAEKFVNYYESIGWVVGKAKMKDWKAAVRTWEKKDGFVYTEKKQEEKQNKKKLIASQFCRLNL